MVRCLAIRAFAAAVTVAALVAGVLARTAAADPILVFPGMEIHQDSHLCTLGYVFGPPGWMPRTAGQTDGAAPLATSR